MSAIDLSKLRWEQNNYWGRAKHFILLSDPLDVFATEAKIDKANKIVHEFRRTHLMRIGCNDELTDTPNTGEKTIRIGRMSAQGPVNTIISSSADTREKSERSLISRCLFMLQLLILLRHFMRNVDCISYFLLFAGIFFWQWFNQTFYPLDNNKNLTIDAVNTTKKLLASFCTTCTYSIGLYHNRKVKVNAHKISSNIDKVYYKQGSVRKWKQ